MAKLAHDVLVASHPLHAAFCRFCGVPSNTRTPGKKYLEKAKAFLERYPQYGEARQG